MSVERVAERLMEAQAIGFEAGWLSAIRKLEEQLAWATRRCVDPAISLDHLRRTLETMRLQPMARGAALVQEDAGDVPLVSIGQGDTRRDWPAPSTGKAMPEI